MKILGNPTISFSLFSPSFKKYLSSTVSKKPLFNKWTKIGGISLLGITPVGLTYLWMKKQINKTEESLHEAEKTHKHADLTTRFVSKTEFTYFEWWCSAFVHVLRFFHLMLIFTPCFLLFPIRIFQRGRNYWLDTFVSAIERAGVVWIKAFQYMSHRRDIIGQQMADKFVHLREHAPEHPYAETKRNFQACYGKQINEIFQQFDPKPIASGSVSQVYKAKYQGKYVAIKVRHPGVDKYIERDINLLFFFSRVFSLFSKSFTIPVTEHSMKRTMHDQINFINEKQNLLIFQEFFKERNDVFFPTPIESKSSDSVLVEQFVEGVPITHYEVNEHPLKPVIARLGAETFFDMLIKHNFIHADAHGGNIMVTMSQKTTSFFGEIWEFLFQKIIRIEDKIIADTIESPLLRKIYVEGREQAAHVRQVLRQAKQRVFLTLIDTGMVITLDERDRRNFLSYLKNVIEGNGNECARLIYNLSSYGGKKINDGEFVQYQKQLHDLFQVVNRKDLQNLPGLQIFSGMLGIIRGHQMKLQGQFATLLTNMLVLEGMAKDIYPEINILKIAIPYFNQIPYQVSHNID